MKERVVFEANVPVTATLAYADGLKVQGRFGDQVMYSLADGRVMYVPPIVRDKLVELGIRQNEPFDICRAERREGNRRFVALSTGLCSLTARRRRPTTQPGTTIRPLRLQTVTTVRESERTATVMAMANQPAHPPVRGPQRWHCAPHSRRASTQLLPRNNTRPHTVCRSASAAKTCGPWLLGIVHK